MSDKDYKVTRMLRHAGRTHGVGETIRLGEREARYLVMAGQIEPIAPAADKAKRPTAPKPTAPKPAQTEKTQTEKTQTGGTQTGGTQAAEEDASA